LARINEPWFNNGVARPKTITDERLLTAAAEVIGRKGPGFTIADVAARAGVSVGTVAQRFGSKSGLLQALTRQTTAAIAARMRAAAAVADPVEGLRAALLSWFEGMTDPVEAQNHLAQLGVDLIDPELRALLAELYEVTGQTVLELTRRVDLPHGPSARLAEDVDAVLDAWKGR
jgi:AcrR family transcriptional regulator